MPKELVILVLTRATRSKIFPERGSSYLLHEYVIGGIPLITLLLGNGMLFACVHLFGNAPAITDN